MRSFKFFIVILCLIFFAQPVMAKKKIFKKTSNDMIEMQTPVQEGQGSIAEPIQKNSVKISSVVGSLYTVGGASLADQLYIYHGSGAAGVGNVEMGDWEDAKTFLDQHTNIHLFLGPYANDSGGSMYIGLSVCDENKEQYRYQEFLRHDGTLNYLGGLGSRMLFWGSDPNEWTEIFDAYMKDVRDPQKQAACIN